MKTIDAEFTVPKRNKNPRKKKLKKKIKREIRQETVSVMQDLGKTDNQIMKKLQIRDKSYMMGLKKNVKSRKLDAERDKRRKKIINKISIVLNNTLIRLNKKVIEDELTAKELIAVAKELGISYVELTKRIKESEHSSSGFVLPMPVNPEDTQMMGQMIGVKRLPAGKGNGES